MDRPSRPSPALQLPTPAFPPPQLAKIQPAPPRPQPIAPRPAPATATTSTRITPPPPAARPAHPPLPPAATAAEPRALPLPKRDEPLTRPAAAAPRKDAPLARNRSLAKPDAGLLGALNNWLRATGQKLLSGFLVKRTRRPANPPMALRERVELTQLRAENRRLRQQLDAVGETRGHGDMLSHADRDDVRS